MEVKHILILIVISLVNLNVTGQWNNVNFNQVEITATYDSVDLTGQVCSWWLMDNKHTRVGPIYSKAMTGNQLQTSWDHYYDLQNIDLLRKGFIHPDSIYEACVTCGYDTLEVLLTPIDRCSEIQHSIETDNIGDWIGVPPYWGGDPAMWDVLYVIDLIWNNTLDPKTNITQTVNYHSINYLPIGASHFGAVNTSFNLRFAFVKPGYNYAIIRVICDEGFLNYKVFDLRDGTVVYKTTVNYGDQKVRVPVKDFKKIAGKLWKPGY